MTIDLSLTDRVVDLMDERADIAIRWGPLPPSDLIARSLGDTGQAIVASPSYLARHGRPRTPRELEAHNRLGWSYRRAIADWPLLVDGRVVGWPVSGTVRVGDGETLRHLALAGIGLARLSRFHVHEDLLAGRLVPVLEKFNPGERQPIHAVYLGKAGQLPARVRAVLDHLVEQLSADPRFATHRASTPRRARKSSRV